MNKLAEVISSSENRTKAYQNGRKYVEEQTGSTSNSCARVASEYLTMAGIIKETEKKMNTRELAKLLLQKTPKPDVILFIDELKPGDIAFSCDMLGMRGAPDHVYIIEELHGWSADIVDNYAATIHTRNLGKGPKTSFAFALRFP